MATISPGSVKSQASQPAAPPKPPRRRAAKAPAPAVHQPTLSRKTSDLVPVAILYDNGDVYLSPDPTFDSVAKISWRNVGQALSSTADLLAKKPSATARLARLGKPATPTPDVEAGPAVAEVPPTA